MLQCVSTSFLYTKCDFFSSRSKCQMNMSLKRQFAHVKFQYWKYKSLSSVHSALAAPNWQDKFYWVNNTFFWICFVSLFLRFLTFLICLWIGKKIFKLKMFKKTFKYYTSKSPPTTHEKVIDFDNIDDIDKDVSWKTIDSICQPYKFLYCRKT